MAIPVCLSGCDSQAVAKTSNAASLPGNGIYFESEGEYHFLASDGRLVRTIAMDNDYYRYDISFDNGKIVAAWGGSPDDEDDENYQTFITAAPPSPGKGAFARHSLRAGKTAEIHHFHGRIAKGAKGGEGTDKGTDFHISPDGKYAAINGTYPVLDPDHPLTIIDLATGEELATFKHPDIHGDEHRVAGWSRDNEVFFTVGKDVLKTGPALGWEPQAVIRLESSHELEPRVNMQGTQLAFRHNYHIYVHDIPSGKTRQATESKAEEPGPGWLQYIASGEYAPAFSPDGNFIAFEWRANVEFHPEWEKFGRLFPMNTILGIVPNDGRLYDLDAKNGGAIFPKDEKDAPIFSTGRKIIWR